MFFHPDGERGHARKRRQQRAKALCAECRVAAQCREHSLMFRERFGIWGGLAEDERDLLIGRSNTNTDDINDDVARTAICE
jgi:WhiB family redox-sensing transcriptional regulator